MVVEDTNVCRNASDVTEIHFNISEAQTMGLSLLATGLCLIVYMLTNTKRFLKMHVNEFFYKFVEMFPLLTGDSKKIAVI